MNLFKSKSSMWNSAIEVNNDPDRPIGGLGYFENKGVGIGKPPYRMTSIRRQALFSEQVAVRPGAG